MTGDARMIALAAWRSIWRSRSRSLITITALAFGLAFSVFMISFADGMYEKLIRDAVRQQAGHVVVEHREYGSEPSVDLVVKDAAAIAEEASRFPDFAESQLFVLGQGVVQSSRESAGVGIVGIDPRMQAESAAARGLKQGRFLAGDDRDAVFVSETLAKRLGVAAGKRVVLSSNDVSGELVQNLFRICGTFATGSDEIDSAVVYVSLTAARALFGMGARDATRVGIMLRDDAQIAAFRTGLAQRLAGHDALAVRTWGEVLPDLFRYVRFDRASSLVSCGILIFIVLFTLFNTILMAILEREREFALLMAIGASPGRLRTQVILESVVLAALGCALGLALGYASSLWFARDGIDMSALYSSPVSVSGFTIDMMVRPRLRLSVAFSMTALAWLAACLMTLVPALRIGRIAITERLR